MLVEVLARTQAEGEPSVGQQLDCGRLLGDHHRMVAPDRAGHVGHERDGRRGLGRRAEHRPGVGGVSLLVQPGEVVVGDHRVVKSGLLGQGQISD